MLKTHKFKIGDLGEIIGAYYVSILFNGEAQKETFKGEFKALDFQFKYSNLFDKDRHRQIALQVKTGLSYGSWVPSSKKWRIDVDKNHVRKWEENNQSVLLVWVKPDKELKAY